MLGTFGYCQMYACCVFSASQTGGEGAGRAQKSRPSLPRSAGRAAHPIFYESTTPQIVVLGKNSPIFKLPPHPSAKHWVVHRTAHTDAKTIFYFDEISKYWTLHNFGIWKITNYPPTGKSQNNECGQKYLATVNCFRVWCIWFVTYQAWILRSDCDEVVYLLSAIHSRGTITDDTTNTICIASNFR